MTLSRMSVEYTLQALPSAGCVRAPAYPQTLLVRATEPTASRARNRKGFSPQSDVCVAPWAFLALFVAVVVVDRKVMTSVGSR